MPDLYDNSNLLDKSFEVYAKVQRLNGSPVPDEASFVGGFIACFGIITGRVDIGLDDNAPLTQTLDSLHKDIAAFGQRIAENQAKQDGLEKVVRAASQLRKRNGG
jgi:hypothetical protein